MIDVGNNVNEEYQNIYQQNFKPDAHKKSLSLSEENLFFSVLLAVALIAIPAWKNWFPSTQPLYLSNYRWEAMILWQAWNKTSKMVVWLTMNEIVPRQYVQLPDIDNPDSATFPDTL